MSISKAQANVDPQVRLWQVSSVISLQYLSLLAPPFLAFDHLWTLKSWWRLRGVKWIKSSEAAITQITAAASAAAAAIGLRLLVFFILCAPVQGMSGPAQIVGSVAYSQWLRGVPLYAKAMAVALPLLSRSSFTLTHSLPSILSFSILSGFGTDY